MGFKGNTDSFSLADVFQNLATNGQTGTLRVFGNGSDEKDVFFQSGQVRHLSRGSKSSLLPPDVFVARGLVGRQQVEQAIDRQKETGSTIGNCLIELGQITEEQLDQLTRHQIEEEIYDLFGWGRADFEFSDGESKNLSATGQFPATGPALPITHLIMEAARRVDEWERLRKLIPSSKEIYAMDLPVRKSVEKGEIELDQMEKRVAQMIDGARDVDDIIVDSGLFKFEVWSALGNFMQSSLIRPARLEELRFAEEDCARQNLPKRRLKVLERILAVGGENQKIRKELAELLAKENDIERACIHFGVLADAEQKAGKEDAAIEIYKRILGISPKHVKAHEQLAAIHAKRGKKREAFVHYQELFETFREQNQRNEARIAGACALECAPEQSDLRNSLIELLLIDNQKEAAGQQLELLGDQAYKAGNVKLAADSYRRAMQHRPGNKQLKKKLADSMLTNEDRRARKRRAIVGFALVLVLGGSAATIGLIETANSSKFKTADSKAKGLAGEALGLAANKKFPEAKQKYEEAAQCYAGLTQLFSPLLHVGQDAKKQLDDFNRRASTMTEEMDKLRLQYERQAKADLDTANGPWKTGNGDMYVAQRAYQKVLDNQYATTDVVEEARKGLEDVNKLIKEFEDGKLQLKPAFAFPSIEAETSFKKAFYTKFKRYLVETDVQMPILVLPNTDKIDIFIDNIIQGTVNAGAAKEQNTFHYAWGPHKLKFTKTGFDSLEVNSADLRSPILKLELLRKPIVAFNLTDDLPPGVQLTSDAVVNGDAIYIGTSAGSLIQIGDSQNHIIRRYELPASTSLNREVYGQIYIHKRASKPDLLAYTTREGECVGIEVTETGFKAAWPSVKSGAAVVAAPPTVLKLPIATDHPVFTLSFGKELYLVDCDDGKRPFGGKLSVSMPQAITTSAIGIDNNSMLVVGCSENMYGIDLGKQTIAKTWATDARGIQLRGHPIIVDSERMIVGGNDGKLYIFDPARSGSKRAAIDLTDAAGAAGSIEAEPLVVKSRVYVGSVNKDGFYCVDLAGNRQLWFVPSPDMGAVTKGAAVLGKSVFFGTETGKLFCIDADKGFPRWIYQTRTGKPFACAPVVIGNRVYCFTVDGWILVFEEQPDN